MTSPTEEEIVARAIAQGLFEQRLNGDEDPDWVAEVRFSLKPDIDDTTLARKVIAALDQYRAKNVGEEFHNLRVLAHRQLRSASDDGWDLSPLAEYIEATEALISSMRAVIEEKDRALDRIAKDLPQRGPQGFEDFSTAYSRIKHIARSTISDGVK